MKNTVKIDYAISAGKIIPLIKIIRPKEMINISESEDVDTRDKLVNHLLQSPCNVNRNTFFELGVYSGPDSNIEVNTIEPIEEQDLFFKFEQAILNRLIFKDEEKSDNNDYERIRDFFDWIKSKNY